MQAKPQESKYLLASLARVGAKLGVRERESCESRASLLEFGQPRRARKRATHRIGDEARNAPRASRHSQWLIKQRSSRQPARRVAAWIALERDRKRSANDTRIELES